MITAEDLKKVYGEGDTATRALTAVSFGLQEGEFASLIGQSGSGKSTLLNLLGRPASGRVLIEGEDTSELDRKELARLRGGSIGFVSQFHHLLPDSRYGRT